MALDFLAPSPGALLVVWNAAVVRHLCVDTVDEPEAIASVPRIPGGSLSKCCRACGRVRSCAPFLSQLPVSQAHTGKLS
jgi:hypothetical protein